MADIVASSPVARTINLARTTVSGSIFGMRPGIAAITPIRPVQPKERILDTSDFSLRLVSNQLSSLTVQMNDIGGALERIAYYIAQDTSLEQLKTRQDQTQEKQLAEEGIRTRQESIIERKIKSALIAPVQAIAQTTQSVLGRLMQFFGTLLGGWLLIKGIQTLKSLSEGNTKKLEEIRDSVIKNIGIAAATLFVINGGFFALVGTIGAITLKITGALGKLIFIKPFQFISKLIGDAIKNIVKPASKLATEGAQAVTKGGAEATAKAATKASGKGLLKGGGKTAARLIPFANIPISAGFAYQNVKEGDIPGAILDLGGMIPGPIGWASLGTGLLYETTTGGGIKSKPQPPKKPTTKLQPKATTSATSAVPPTIPPETPPPSTVTQPQSSLTPNINQFKLNVNNYSNVFSGVEEQQDLSQPPMYGDIKIPPENIIQEPIAPPQAQIAPLPVAQMQQRTEQLTAPLPEPKPTIVMARTSSAQQGGAASQGPSVSGPANNVPAISSSNPENFYTLYSQIHYNVVT